MSDATPQQAAKRPRGLDHYQPDRETREQYENRVGISILLVFVSAALLSAAVSCVMWWLS